MKPTVTDNFVHVTINGERIAVWCDSREAADRVAGALYREMQDPGFAWLVCMVGGWQAVHMTLSSMRTRLTRRVMHDYLTCVHGEVEPTVGPVYVLDKLTVAQDGTVVTSTPPVRGLYARLASAAVVEVCRG